MRLRIRTRLTLVFTALTALVLGATGTFVYLRFDSDLEHTVNTGLRSQAQTLLAGIEQGTVDFSDSSGLIDEDEAFAQVLTRDGDILESSPSVASKPMISAAMLGRLSGDEFFELRIQTPEEPVVTRLLAVESETGDILVLGASLEEQHEALARLLTAMLLGGAAALALTTWIGWMVAGAALKPVESMRLKAAEISATEPGSRLPVSSSGDEIARLGQTLNDMLARLEEALARERRFVGDASHELRTPLGILKTELELALRKARTTDELVAALRSAAEESDRLNRLAEDLLTLARADRGRLPVRIEDCHVHEVVEDAVKRFDGLAANQGVELKRDLQPIEALVDPTRVSQVVSNLTENALRYAPKGSRVDVDLRHSDGSMTLSVRDSGPGFPSEFLSQAFDAFSRADSARTRASGGAGLGLTIVKAIVEAHGGTAVVRNAPAGGGEVELVFPLRPPSDS